VFLRGSWQVNRKVSFYTSKKLTCQAQTVLSPSSSRDNGWLRRAVKKLSVNNRKDSITPTARRKLTEKTTINRDQIRSSITEHFALFARNPLKSKVSVGRERYVYVRAGGLSSEFYTLMSEFFEDEAKKTNKNCVFTRNRKNPRNFRLNFCLILHILWEALIWSI
jgi:hypothetical protein